MSKQFKDIGREKSSKQRQQPVQRSEWEPACWVDLRGPLAAIPGICWEAIWLFG